MGKYMIDFDEEEKKLSRLETELEIKKKQLSKKEDEQVELIELLETLRESQAVIQAAAKITQESLEIQLSSAVSALLHGVLDDPYNFKVEFVPKRNSMECNLLFERKDGELIRQLKPLDGCGYGAADLASIGLKTSFMTLKENCRNTLIVDEPLKQLQKDKHHLAAKILKEISEQLNMQFIIATHEESLIDEADKVFRVTKQNNISEVVEE